jgi:hypothetical protein
MVGREPQDDRPAVTATDDELQRVGNWLTGVSAGPFSPQAFAALQDKINRYITQLVEESNKVAKRHQSDTISEKHVNTASDYLVSDTSRRFFRHLGTTGGILLGAGLSNLFSMVTVRNYTGWGVGVTTVGCIIGAFLIALHFARD